MSDAAMGPNDRFSIVRRDSNGVGTVGAVTDSVARAGMMATQPSVANITDAASGAQIATAVNGILAALRANNILLPPT